MPVTVAARVIRGRRRPLPIALACAWAVTCLGCGQGISTEQSERFAQVESAFAEAETEKDYLRVAGSYQQLLDEGLESSAVLFNQGNAFMRADRPGEAIASYRQALRLNPRHPAIRANLEAALGETEQSEQPPDLFHRVFFWQDALSYAEKFALTTLLICLTAAAGLAMRFRRHPVATRACWAAGTLTILSLISTLHDWYHFEHVRHGVVITETLARKGNGASYEAAFNQPLGAGTEFTVREQRGDWLHVDLPDADGCWLPESAVTVY